MPPPAQPLTSEERPEVNDSHRSGDRVDGDNTSSSAQARMLLTALRNVIVPLVQTALPNQQDLQQVPFGPEAEEFLVALQKYIASIVRDHSQSDRKVEGTRTVKLEDICPIDSKKQDEGTAGEDGIAHHDISPVSGRNPSHLSHYAEELVLSRDLLRDELNAKQNAINILLDLLRPMVFNTMPIRLLSFEKHGSKLDITLLNRTEIYSRLASKLRDRVFKAEFRRSELQIIPDIFERMKWPEELSNSYAILSHTWLHSSPGEVTYDDWYQGTFDSTHPGYRKLANFCRVALEEHGLTLGWMDTVCINKESSAELDESIRSMYKWYQNAQKCIVYLAETATLSDMHNDPWFTRGWTLQELLAPSYVTFYGADWTTLSDGSINDKEDINILRQIESATTIAPTELIAPKSQTISRKMQWAAKRNVTRREDVAYSLMGIFDVSISIAYGEGADLAFVRLIKEILNTAKSDVLDLFNWSNPILGRLGMLPNSNFDLSASALVPSHPAAYIRSGKYDFGRMSLIEPLALTHLGLRIPVVLIPAVPHHLKTAYTPIGDYSSTVRVETDPFGEYATLGEYWNILETPLFASPSFSRQGAPLGLAFAVLNCGGSSDSDVLLFKRCLTIAILYSHNNGVATPLGYKCKVKTTRPISFELENRSRSSEDDWEYDAVSTTELARHGMQFLTMYL